MALPTHHEKTTKREKTLGVLFILVTLMGIAYSCLTKVDPKEVEWFPPLPIAVETCRSLAWIQVPLFAGLASVLALAKKQASISIQLRLIHELLNDFHGQVFERGVSLAENRVTLFKHENEWLHVVERSHHLTRKSRARFRVLDSGEPEGIAGQAWVTKAIVYVSHLPNISPSNEKVQSMPFWAKTRVHCCEWLGRIWFLDFFWPVWWSHRVLSEVERKACKQYADRSWISPEKAEKSLRRRKALPRAMCGIPVEVSGKPWGVIVIDSRRESLPTEEQIDKFYRAHSKMLERLIKLL